MMEKNSQPVGWHSRGYLPHFDGGEISQVITFRLGDSVSASVIDRWKQELAQESDEVRDSLLRRRIETYLDQGYGACHLKEPEVGEKVESSMLHFDGERYRLRTWVVMPNHAHMLLTPCAGYDLSGIMHSIKSYTANEANRLLKRKGQFWQEDYFDRFIRNQSHYESVVAYIENNPVKAKLCERPEDWRFSSAWWRKNR